MITNEKHQPPTPQIPTTIHTRRRTLHRIRQHDKTKKQTKRQYTITTHTKPRTTKNTNPKQMRFTNSRNPSEEIPQTTKKPTQQCKKRSNTPIIPILPK